MSKNIYQANKPILGKKEQQAHHQKLYCIMVQMEDKRFDDFQSWRKIAIRGSQSLEVLAKVIVQNFDLRFEQQFAFADTPKLTDAKEGYIFSVDAVKNGSSLPKDIVTGQFFDGGGSKYFFYDLSAMLCFTLTCQEIREAEPKVRYPQILEKNGKGLFDYRQSGAFSKDVLVASLKDCELYRHALSLLELQVGSKKKSEVQADSNEYLKLKITLSLNPPIWRSVVVSAFISFADLHRVIQIAMGWTNSHLYSFEGKNISIGEDTGDFSDYGDAPKNQNVYKITLDQFFTKKGQKISYIYDFGDNWEHEIKLDKFLTPKELSGQIPCCLDGEGACPQEDSGGMWGYVELLEILKDPNHPDYEEFSEYYPDLLDIVEKGFDKEEVNRYFKNMKFKQKRKK